MKDEYTECPWCAGVVEARHHHESSTYFCMNPDCREEWQTEGLHIEENDVTNRNFRILKFTDHNGYKCSLQESSASGVAVWLGTEGDIKVGPPWRDFKKPDNMLVCSRMHLTQRQVRELLPYLQYVAEHGCMPSCEEDLKEDHGEK